MCNGLAVGVGSGGSYAQGKQIREHIFILIYIHYIFFLIISLSLSMSVSMLYSVAAALALIDQPNLSAEEVVRKAMKIAGDICVYTNHNITCELLPSETPDTSTDNSPSGGSTADNASLSTTTSTSTSSGTGMTAAVNVHADTFSTKDFY